MESFASGIHVNWKFTDLIDLTAVEMSQSNPNFEVFPSVLHQKWSVPASPLSFLDETALFSEIYEKCQMEKRKIYNDTNNNNKKKRLFYLDLSKILFLSRIFLNY